MNIFENLFFGKIFPSENICPKSAAYRAVNKEISAEFDFWREKLSDADFSKLEHFSYLTTESHLHELQEAFAYGFKFASLLLLEALRDENELTKS